MEVLKWVFSATLALAMTLLGIGLAIGATIIGVMLKLIGIFGFIAAAIAMLIKEQIDERSRK